MEAGTMEQTKRLHWLRIVLVIKVALTFLAWGLPALFGSKTFLAIFDITMPEDPLFVRLFGALVVAVGVAYWYAYQDPVKNVAIIKFGIVDNGLVFLTIVFLGITAGVSSWFIWLSGFVAAIFCVSFIVLMPRSQEPSS
jgi:hypothetical protein